MTTPRIGIVIPAYNAGLFLRDAIDSVLAQTFESWELVIVDDGSSDSTFEIASRYANSDSRIRAILQENSGVAVARNRGVGLLSVETEFVSFLDHDDVWYPKTLDTLLRKIEEHPDAVASHGLSRQTDLDGRPYGCPKGVVIGDIRRRVEGKKIVRCLECDPTTFAVMLCECFIPTPGCVLIRKKSLLDVGPFDQSVAPGDDWDMWLRLTAHGYFAFVNQIVMDWRQHGANGSRQKDIALVAEMRVRKKTVALPELTPAQRSSARWRYYRRCANIERHYTKSAWNILVESIRNHHRDRLSADLRDLFSHYRDYLAIRMYGALDRIDKVNVDLTPFPQGRSTETLS